MNCHVLCTLLNPDRIKSCLLVFKTIKTGFPTANLLVYGNGIKDREGRNIIEAVARDAGAQYVDIPMHSHGQWIENIMANESQPFWICDTDVVFFDKVENWFDNDEPFMEEYSPDPLFAGRYEPEFWEDWTKTIHVSRLHPSLMWMNAQPLRAAIRAWPGKHQFFSSVNTNLIQWSIVPHDDGIKQNLCFYDTCAGLHHALGGAMFTEEQNKSYGHLFCGTYADMISEQHPNLASRHDAVWDNPELARTLWEEQKKWYAENVTRPAPVTPRPQ